MADSADIAVQSSNYRGDAVLGGSGGEAFKFDMKPLEQLAAYVNLEQKNFWEQSQKNTDKMVDMIATNMEGFDANLMYGKDREKMIAEAAETNKEIANALNNQPPRGDVAAYGKWYADTQQKVMDLKAKFETRKKRTASRIAAITKVKEMYPDDAALQASAIKEIDDKFNSTDGDFETPSLWKPVELPKFTAQTKVVENLKLGGDDNVQTSTTIFDTPATKAAANAAYFGIKAINDKFPAKTIKDASGNDIPNPKYAEWAKGKSEQEISQAQAANTGNSAESRRLADQTYQAYSKAVGKPEYRNADGTFNKKLFLASEPKLITDIYESGEAYNAYNAKMANPQLGLSNEGVPYTLPTNYNPEDYKNAIIPDLSKVEPADLMTWKAFSEFGDNKVTEIKSTHTGQKSQNDKTDATLANQRTIARENNANEIAKIILQAKINGAKKDENGNWVPAANATEAKQNKMINKPAVLFQQNAERVKSYFERKGLKDTEGMNVPIDKLDPITRKALGMGKGFKPDETPDETKDDVSVTFFKNGTYKINKKDGTQIPGTAEGLAQGYINALGTAQGFQADAENAFEGTGQDVWDRVVNTQPAKNENTTSGFEFGGVTYSDDEIEQKAKSFGYTADEYKSYLKSLKK